MLMKPAFIFALTIAAASATLAAGPDEKAFVLKYGRNEQIRRMAQEIIVTQEQEIIAMRRAVGEQP